MTAAKLDLGGTLRARDVSDTLEWVRPLLPHFGISRVANITGLDRIGIPVWVAVRPHGRSLSVSQGKGLTPELAQASAVMEAIECHYSEHVAAPDFVAPYGSARRRHDVVAPRTLQPGLRWSQYDDSRPIAWIRGTDLDTGGDAFLPHARVDLDWTRAHPDAGLFLATSTGLASGNTWEEALCHAIFEVVERDTEWRWDRLAATDQRATELDPDSVDPPMLRGLLERFAAAGVSVSMWDMTSEVGIPVYYCSISDSDPFGGPATFGGSGCHLSKEIALSRALTEAAQSRLTFIAGSRDDLFPDAYVAAEDGTRATRPRPPLDFSARQPPPLGTTFAEDLATALRLLHAAGFRRVIAFDHTTDLGIPVVNVLVPGARESEHD